MSTVENLDSTHYRLRKCDSCGKVEPTHTRLRIGEGKDICEECSISQRLDKATSTDIEYLAGLGYKNPVFSHLNAHKKRAYTVITPCCGKEHTMLTNNIKSLFKKNGKVPCPTCGGRDRIAAANEANKVNAIKTQYNPMENIDDYTRLVFEKAMLTMTEYKDILLEIYGEKPINLKVDIEKCFKMKVPVATAGSILNVVLGDGVFDLDIQKWVTRDLSQFGPMDLMLEGTK